MRVEGNRRIRPAATRRDDKSGAASVGSFAEVLGAETAAAPAAAAPTGSVGALFALQEAPDAPARRHTAGARAAKILHRLGELQLCPVHCALDQPRLADFAA